MRISVYLSNGSIAAAAGGNRRRGLKVGPCCRREIPRGLVYNGTLVDPEPLVPLVSGFFSENRLDKSAVSLVIDSDAVAGRVLEVPPLPRRELRRLIRHELTPGQDPQGFVYDYCTVSPHSPGGGGRIYAVAAERGLVEGFMGLFAQAGVRLRGIDLAHICAMRFFQRAPEYAGKTFVYTALDGPDVLSFLFTDCAYAFMDRGQLTQARGTPGAAVEISRVLSSMVQYHYVSPLQSPLSDVYISGLVGEEARFYGEIADALNSAETRSITVGPVAPMASLPAGALDTRPAGYGEYIFCLGDLMGPPPLPSGQKP